MGESRKIASPQHFGLDLEKPLVYQLHLECVMFVSSISLFKEPAKILQEAKIVEKVINVFKWHSDDVDI